MASYCCAGIRHTGPVHHRLGQAVAYVSSFIFFKNLCFFFNRLKLIKIYILILKSESPMFGVGN
jgi:hypothetical protein